MKNKKLRFCVASDYTVLKVMLLHYKKQNFVFIPDEAKTLCQTLVAANCKLRSTKVKIIILFFLYNCIILYYCRIKFYQFIPVDCTIIVTKVGCKLFSEFVNHLRIRFHEIIVTFFCFMTEWLNKFCVKISFS